MQIDLEDTEHPICPYCGHVYDGIDPGEWVSTTMDCDECGKLFRCVADYSVTYYTYKTRSDKPVEERPIANG